MTAFQKGEARAFEELIRRHEKGVFNFIYRFFNNREVAEDVFQEAFFKVHQAADRYYPNGKFSTWLYTIVRNLCVDTFRRRKIRETISLESGSEDENRRLGDNLAADEIPADVLASAREIQGALEMVLEKLNPEQREVFLMRERAGLKFEEIAEVMGVSVNTVKSRMRYALEALKRSLRHSKFRELLEK